MNEKKFYHSQKCWLTLSRSQLSRLLRGFRKLNRVPPRAIETKLKEFEAKHKGDPDCQLFRKVINRQFGGRLTALESPGSPNATIELPTIKPLAFAYDLHELMFDPLLAETVRDNFLLHRHAGADDFERVDQKGFGHYGKSIKYQVPKRILYGTDNIQIVYLEIQPGGYSVSHFHHGDELLYVDEGSVELWLQNTGFRIRLKKGEFSHFDAGQLHSACNPSKGGAQTAQTAKIFLIRFIPLESGSRARLFRELVVSRPSPKIVKRLITEMKASYWTGNTRQERYAPSTVFDTYGLGYFLQLLCSRHFVTEGHRGPSLDDLVYRSKQKKYKHTYTRAKFARLHNGEARISREELPELADIYGVSRMLFYNFLFPAFRYAVVVGENDMRKIGPKFGISSPDVVYKVPCRHLAYSDITIALVELAAKTSTPRNRHPGFELLKPLKGEVTVKFRGTAGPSIKEGEYGLFYSHIEHEVHNQTNRPARMLVFRFLE